MTKILYSCDLEGNFEGDVPTVDKLYAEYEKLFENEVKKPCLKNTKMA